MDAATYYQMMQMQDQINSVEMWQALQTIGWAIAFVFACVIAGYALRDK